ncbi:hypothetical protein RRG08_030875 [Elysia crispata]|uniref:Uncharacterized protein n=1 Tax=Elysia crispata TaxID=231223 RepID=A0AAE0XT67_9GAST|nr:hypothetical protein RRG08_030875 [Elysia crispata]
MAIVLAVTPSVQLRRSVYVDKHRRWGQHSSGTKNVSTQHAKKRDLPSSDENRDRIFYKQRYHSFELEKKGQREERFRDEIRAEGSCINELGASPLSSVRDRNPL